MASHLWEILVVIKDLSVAIYVCTTCSYRESHPPPPFRVVVHSKVNPNEYSTVSLRGVTRMLGGREAEFTELEQWIVDYKHFNQLSKIRTFAKFRLWKAFSTWRKNVQWRCAGNHYMAAACINPP